MDSGFGTQLHRQQMAKVMAEVKSLLKEGSERVKNIESTPGTRQQTFKKTI